MEIIERGNKHFIKWEMMKGIKIKLLLLILPNLLFYNCTSEETTKKNNEGIFGLYHGFMDLSLRLNSDSTYNFHSQIANDTGIFALRKDTLYFISKYEKTSTGTSRSFSLDQLIKLLDSAQKGYRIDKAVNGKMIFKQDTFYSLGTSFQYKYYKTL